MDSLPVLQHTLPDSHTGVSALFPNNFIGRLSVRGFLMSTAVFFVIVVAFKGRKNSLGFTMLVMY